ncbi:MAG: TfoX C-terminal domain [Anaerospora sp.]|nr:TfoX C-terminal domain [Anaerospora sp.]
MKRLSEMPNIGITLERLLVSAGIETPEVLVKLGSKTAFLQPRAALAFSIKRHKAGSYLFF